MQKKVGFGYIALAVVIVLTAVILPVLLFLANKEFETDDYIEKNFTISLLDSENSGGGYYEISSYIGNGEKISIPNRYRGKEIKSIGADSFTHNGENVKSLILPSSLKIIKKSAFKNLTNLTSVKIGGIGNLCLLETIEESAFENCENLVEITLPSFVREIGNRAFYGCTNLNEVTLFTGVNVFGEDVFTLSGAQILIIKDTVSVDFSDIDFDVFQNFTTLKINNVQTIESNCFANTNLVSVSLINITEIKSNAFAELATLTDVTLKNIDRIGVNSFINCNNIVSLNMLNCKEIGSSAFKNCNKITGINLAGTMRIESEAFYCTSPSLLTEITLSTALVLIDSNAFYNCTQLTTLNISGSGIFGNAIRTDDVFLISTRLPLIETINISGTVGSIGVDAFKYLSELRNVNFEEESDCKILYSSAFYGCTSLTEITLPCSIKEIKDTVFAGCSALQSLTFGTGMTSVNNTAINNCNNLASIYVKGDYVLFGLPLSLNNENLNIYVKNEQVKIQYENLFSANPKVVVLIDS